MTIRFSADAEKDLQELSEYTLQVWGEKQEARYLDQIWERLEGIAQDPSEWRTRNDLLEGCRAAPVGRHVIFFLAKGDLIVVSRILHQSMDFPRHLFPDQ